MPVHFLRVTGYGTNVIQKIEHIRKPWVPYGKCYKEKPYRIKQYETASHKKQIIQKHPWLDNYT
jgi:hypothetical protein